MNLDTDKDYFLHNFQSDDEPDASNPDRTPTPGESVDFTSDSDSKPKSPRRGCMGFWGWFFLIIGVALGMTFYLRYMSPYATDSLVTGHVTSVERRGLVFKTFEGQIISRTALADTTHIYQRDITFSIPSDSLALELQRYQASGRPVTIKTEKYYGTLPWRGASNVVAVAIEPVESL